MSKLGRRICKADRIIRPIPRTVGPSEPALSRAASLILSGGQEAADTAGARRFPAILRSDVGAPDAPGDADGVRSPSLCDDAVPVLHGRQETPDTPRGLRLAAVARGDVAALDASDDTDRVAADRSSAGRHRRRRRRHDGAAPAHTAAAALTDRPQPALRSRRAARRPLEIALRRSRGGFGYGDVQKKQGTKKHQKSEHSAILPQRAPTHRDPPPPTRESSTMHGGMARPQTPMATQGYRIAASPVLA